MTADIIVLPIDRHVYFVRETARVLERRQGEAANRFWKMTCRRLYGRLQIQGMTEELIQNEIRAFTQAVQLEMQRASAAPWSTEYPKGAA
jgi:hypothetical protein